ncbi:MAG: hypothetical protein LUD72_02130 [Bacteroidales bacterium]|nr:hypothetical protein [Bacteroidales bacterium]
MFLRRTLTVLVLTVTAAGRTFAQEAESAPSTAPQGTAPQETAVQESKFTVQNDIGAIFSLNRSGIIYSRTTSPDIFWNISLAIDYGDCILRHSVEPGVTAAFSYNFVIRNWTHKNGSSHLYAGPGVTLGYAHDHDKSYGFIGAVTGTFGYEYRFNIPVTLSVGIVPTLGVHVGKNDARMLMELYSNGLAWSLGPQVSLKYCLGEGKRHKSGSDETDNELITASQNDLGTAPDPEKRTWPLFTYGLEWGYSANVNHAYHYNYTSPIGRIDIRENDMCFKNNAYVSAHFGLNCSRHFNLAIFGGYESIYRGQAVIPLSMRGTWLFGKNTMGSRWLAFLDGGWAFSTSDYKAGAIGKAGAGYRISLSRSVKLDFMLSYEFASTDVDVYDEAGDRVSPSRIRRNDNYFSSINFSIGLTL